MGKRMLPVSLGLAAAVLSGCMGEAAEPVVEEVQPEAPAFHFASGTLELGDFDPATLGDDLFDPCTEISAEEYAAAGMTGVEPEPVIAESSNGLALGCDSDPIDHGIDRSIVSSRTPAAGVSETAGYELSYPETEVPDAYLMKNPVVSPYLCAAQVDTTRGALGVSVSVSGIKKESIDACVLALDNLERLYKASGQEAAEEM